MVRRRFMPPERVVDLVVGALGELGKVEQLARAFAEDRARQVEVAPEHLEVLAHGELELQSVLLGIDPDAPADLGAVGGRIQPEEG